MSLSKPIISLAGFYFEQMYNNPLRTQTITTAFLASSANMIAQLLLSPKKAINWNSVLTYTKFGGLYDGPIPFYMYTLLDKLIPEDGSFSIAHRLFWERLVFYPIYQAFVLYILAVLEKKDHKTAVKELKSLYWSFLTNNWIFLTPVHLFNSIVVPPIFRLQIINIATLAWTIYLAYKRRQNDARINPANFK